MNVLGSLSARGSYKMFSPAGPNPFSSHFPPCFFFLPFSLSLLLTFHAALLAFSSFRSRFCYQRTAAGRREGGGEKNRPPSFHLLSRDSLPSTRSLSPSLLPRCPFPLSPRCLLPLITSSPPLFLLSLSPAAGIDGRTNERGEGTERKRSRRGTERGRGTEGCQATSFVPSSFVAVLVAHFPLSLSPLPDLPLPLHQ